MDFTFGQVEAVCAAMQDIASDKRPAFTSRLKHLMQALAKADEHPNTRPGRGKAAKFSFSHLMKVVIGVELIQAGTPPSLAAMLVQGNWMSLRVGVHFALYNEVEKRAAGDPREETYWLLAPEALRDLTSSGESRFDHYEAFATIYRLEDLVAHFNQHEVGGVTGHYRRQLILNGTAITRAAAFLISGEFHIASIQELQQDIFDEIDQDQKRLDQALEQLKLRELSADTEKSLAKMLPAYQAFDERWEQRVFKVLEKLTPTQQDIIGAELGSEVELTSEDMIALRKYDLIGIQQGELVITDLGQEVTAEVRRRAGKDEPHSPRMRRQLQRSTDLIRRARETGNLGKPDDSTERRGGDGDG